MREKVQPHTTKLEQDVASLRDAVPEGLQQFWSDLGENPDDALVKLAAEVYPDNDEAAEIFKVAIKYAAQNPEASDAEVAEAAATHVEEGGTADEFEVELDPEDRERLNYVDRKMLEDEDAAYRADLDKLQEDNPDDFPRDAEGKPLWDTEKLVKIMSPFIVAAPEEMDDEEAMEHAFNAYKEARALIMGGEPGTEDAAAEAAASLSPEQIAAINARASGPPVITGGQNASVPANKDYGGDLGAAVRDFGAELAAKNNAPPVV